MADRLPQYTDVATCSSPNIGVPGLVMDYFDGDTPARAAAYWSR